MIRKDKKNTLPEIQMTALPDIIFMLLFFFMVVTVLRKEPPSDKIKIPEVAYGELIKDPDIVAVSIEETAAGTLYTLGQKRYDDLDILSAALHKKYLAEGPSKLKLVGDKNTSMHAVNQLKGTLQASHYDQVEYLIAVK